MTDDQRRELLSLLQSDLVTEPTRHVLSRRLEVTTGTPGFFAAPDYATLEAVSARLIPQNFTNLALEVDLRLARGETDGWRYDALPPDGEAYRQGLRALERSSQEQFGESFAALTGERQDALLGAAQTDQLTGEGWDGFAVRRFFEDLLAELTELYMSHPLAQQEIGYIGFADAHGWQRVGLNESALEPFQDLLLPTLEISAFDARRTELTDD
jgi:gluconate 2-dehydrogenase gamma chain